MSAVRDRKPNAFVQISAISPMHQSVTRYSNTEIVLGTRDPLFLAGVTFPQEYPIYEETRIKLTVYDVKDKSQETRSFLGCTTFKVGDLLKSEEQKLTLSLRTLDGGKEVGIIEVSRMTMGETEDGVTDNVTKETQEQKCVLDCECPSPGNALENNSPLFNAVFKNPISKVYRFPAADKWLYVREQMAESILSFHIPKELISLFIKEDTSRIQELKELGELSPHWDHLRQSAISQYEQIVIAYQETLAELNKLTGSYFKPSCSRGEKTLEFIPVNLHLQRMHVHSPKHKDAVYDVITVGAPAAHFQGFKSGGLRRLLSRYEAEKRNTGYQCIYYSTEHTEKAKEVLSSINQLQPLISSHADLLLHSAQQQSSDSLKESLKMLSEKTEEFVHAFKDQLVRSALLALYTARPSCANRRTSEPSNSEEKPEVQQMNCPPPVTRQDSIPHHSEYNEEEWDRAWANVAMSLNCIIQLSDRLLEQDGHSKQSETEGSVADVITSHNTGDWHEQLYPLVVTLKECIEEVVERAKKSMTFVLLQEAACGLPQGVVLNQRRDMVFSQALAGLVCGFIIKLYTSLQDQLFLLQLHTVGIVAQYEGLLSMYSDEIGMLEDMAVGISDLKKVTFRVVEATSDDLHPVLTGRRECCTVEVKVPTQMFEQLPEEIKGGKLMKVYPILFNVGINEQQTLAERFGNISLQESINLENLELLQQYYKSFTEKLSPDSLPQFQTATDLKEMFENLQQNIDAKKKKNVEILWLAAAICRQLNGIRFTCCKSAKDRTSMSVTLEQCTILRDEHELHKDFFIRALDCMRREGCRIENAQKNAKCRKYAFNMIQLMAFPKYYRPPEGTYGKSDT
ncbi:inositol polyphosphate 4-phosphatase type II isoform X2 [Protopterus annectens]|nr:inositol polyphosphate 4-phosphatase type II isoform X2 [Protopterus annectens]